MSSDAKCFFHLVGNPAHALDRCPLPAPQEAIFCLQMRYPRGIIRRLIDVNDDKLEAVRTLLGTGTLKATVDAAFDEVLALDERRRALPAERGVDLLKGWPTSPVNLLNGSCPRVPSCDNRSGI